MKLTQNGDLVFLAHYLLHFMKNSSAPQNLILVSILFNQSKSNINWELNRPTTISVIMKQILSTFCMLKQCRDDNCTPIELNEPHIH